MQNAHPLKPKKPFFFQRQLNLLGIDTHPTLFFCALFMLLCFACLSLLEFIQLSTLWIACGTILSFAMILLAINAFTNHLVDKFERQLVDALVLVQASLQSGQSAPQALALTARSTKGRVSKELSYIANGLDQGLPISKATQRLKELYKSESVKLFTQTLIARSHTGADLATLLTPVNRVIRERVHLKTKIDSQLSGPRYATYFMATLPYLLIPYFMWKDPNWLTIFKQHELGLLYFLSALACQLIGFIWLHIVAQKV